jgi:hypothetical protein
MERYVVNRLAGGPCLEAPSRGAALLRHPIYNKGTAFSHEERRAFALRGLLPAAVSSLEQQGERVYANIVRKKDGTGNAPLTEPELQDVTRRRGARSC